MSGPSDKQVVADPETPPAGRSWADRTLPDGLLWLCAALTVGLVLMPPEGLPGVELCVFKRLTNVPCPGCGLTRCGSNLVRGNVVRAAEYNPFGLMIIPMMAALGVLGVLPRRWREQVRKRLTPWSTTCQRLLIAFTVAFVAFGLIRGFGVARGWIEFPARWH